ncbi:MAG: amidohydrolase family protein [Planctomycetota bacterium]
MRRIYPLTILIAVGFLVLAGCASRPGDQETSTVTAFINVGLVPMTGERVVEGQTVLVEGREIVAIGRTGEVDVPDDAVVIDGTNAYLMPGLIDMHTHAQDDWVESDEWPVSPLVLFLANGVTTIRDCGHTGDITLPLRWRKEIEAGLLDGPVIYTPGSVMWGDRRGPIYPGVVQEQVAQGYDFLKVKTAYADEFALAMDQADQLGVYTVGHIPYQVGLEGVLEAELDEIAHVEEFLFDYVGVDPTPHLSDEEWFANVIAAAVRMFGTDESHLSPQAIEAAHGDAMTATATWLRSAGTFVGTTAALNGIVDQKVNDRDAYLARPKNRYLSRDCRDRISRGQDRHQLQVGEMARAGVAYLLPGKARFDEMVLVKLHEAGVLLLLAPDSGGGTLCFTPGYAVHDELDTLIETGFTPYEALVTATVNPARAIEAMTGVRDVGTIEVGKRADLILVAGNPLEDVSILRKPLGVMAAGRWYARETLQQMIQIGE